MFALAFSAIGQGQILVTNDTSTSLYFGIWKIQAGQTNIQVNPVVLVAAGSVYTGTLVIGKGIWFDQILPDSGFSSSGLYLAPANQNTFDASQIINPVPEPSTNVFFCLSALVFFTLAYRRQLRPALPSSSASAGFSSSVDTSCKPCGQAPQKPLTAGNPAAMAGNERINTVPAVKNFR